MSTIVSIHLNIALDADLRAGEQANKGREREASIEFRKLIAAHGLKVEPLFPGRRSSAVECIWHAACPDRAAAAIVEKLLNIPGVEGAYIKPPEALPGSE